MSINSHANPDGPGISIDGSDTNRARSDRSRRDLLRIALLASAMTPALARAQSQVLSTKIRAFRLIEAEGFRRSSYPIHATIEGAGRATRFRLTSDGRPIEAQFRPIDGPNHDVALDFEADLGPGETRRYEVHSGLGVEPGPAPRAKLEVEPIGDEIRIIWPGGLALRIGRGLFDEPGPLREVGTPRLSYLARTGSRFEIESVPVSPFGVRSDRPPRVEIAHQGPLAVAARVKSGPLEGGGSASLALTCTRGQPWIEAILHLEDPRRFATGLRFEFAPGFEPDPAETRSGVGWLRLADDLRSVTIATGDEAQFTLGAGGRMTLRREFDPTEPLKTLAFRLAFDLRSGPPAGRGVEPESMLRPPRVEWDRPSPPSNIGGLRS